MNYIEIDINNEYSIKLFKKFYEVLKSGFDESELETYEQLIDTLNKKDNGFFKNNSYHILVTYNENNTIYGGIIYDYFFNTNSGIIEYIVTNKDLKQKGIGTKLFEKACSNLNNEAKEKGFNRINFISCEVEKELNEKMPNNIFWDKFGFKALDFNYIQPPLDEEKEAVYIINFGIIKKAPLAEYESDYVTSDILKSVLHDYLFYTMRIDNVYENEYYLEMSNNIDTIKNIKFKKENK